MRSSAQIHDGGRKRGGNLDDVEVCPQAGAMEQFAWERRELENRKVKYGVLRKIYQKFVKIFQIHTETNLTVDSLRSQKFP
jgi:hypothetical protein